MPAVKSIIGQCHFCCAPELSLLSAPGKRYSGMSAYGFIGFNDGSFDPANPTAWLGRGLLWSNYSFQENTILKDGQCAPCCCVEDGSDDDRYGHLTYDRSGTLNHAVRPFGTWITEIKNENGCDSYIPPTSCDFDPSCEVTEYKTSAFSAYYFIDDAPDFTASVSLTDCSISGSKCTQPVASEYIESTSSKALSSPVSPTYTGETSVSSFWSYTKTGTILTTPYTPEFELGAIIPKDGSKVLGEHQIGAIQLKALGKPTTEYLVTLKFFTTTSISQTKITALPDVEIEVTTNSLGEAVFTYTMPEAAVGAGIIWDGITTSTIVEI